MINMMYNLCSRKCLKVSDFTNKQALLEYAFKESIYFNGSIYRR